MSGKNRLRRWSLDALRMSLAGTFVWTVRSFLPPTVSFQQDAPGETYLMPPATQLTTVLVVHSPQGEAHEKYAEAVRHHLPHSHQDLVVPRATVNIEPVRTSILGVLCCKGAWLPDVWFQSEVELHQVHHLEQNNCCQYGINSLVKTRILKIVVVEGDEQSQSCQRYPENNTKQ